MLVYTVCGFNTLFIFYDSHMASSLMLIFYRFLFSFFKPTITFSSYDFKDERLDTVSDVISDNLIIYGIIFWYISMHYEEHMLHKKDCLFSCTLKTNL